MTFALLIAAIIWNLGPGPLGLPASSSHVLIGSVIGVGLANQLLAGASGTSGIRAESRFPGQQRTRLSAEHARR
jgi:inorganic phosphate transporter, PiT family